jgi:hypothetical protein
MIVMFSRSNLKGKLYQVQTNSLSMKTFVIHDVLCSRNDQANAADRAMKSELQIARRRYITLGPTRKCNEHTP